MHIYSRQERYVLSSIMRFGTSGAFTTAITVGATASAGGTKCHRFVLNVTVNNTCHRSARPT